MVYDHANMPCAVTLDLNRHLAREERLLEAAEVTEGRRAERAEEILSNSDALLEAVTEFGDDVEFITCAVAAYVQRDPSLMTAVCEQAAQRMANHEIKDVTPEELRAEADEARAEARRDDRYLND